MTLPVTHCTFCSASSIGISPASTANISQPCGQDPFSYDPLEHNIVTGYLTPVYPEEAVAVRNWTATLPSSSLTVNCELASEMIPGLVDCAPN